MCMYYAYTYIFFYSKLGNLKPPYVSGVILDLMIWGHLNDLADFRITRCDQNRGFTINTTMYMIYNIFITYICIACSFEIS